MTFTNLPEDYKERLDAVANYRFEIKDRKHAIERETLAFNDGKPKPSVRYNFSWWTPEGDRKIDETVLFLEPKGLSIVATMHDEMHVPGDNQWAILLNAKDEPEVNFGVFWTTAYLWRHSGSCGVKEWDEALTQLRKEAGNP